MSHRTRPAPGPAVRTTRPTRRARVLLGAALTAPLLTACSFTGTTTDAATSGAGPAEEGDGGQRISVVMVNPPRSGLTPLSDDAFKLSRWSTAETLVVLDGPGDPQPALATAWAPVDATTWRFDVREGVTFHDGTALTPADVVRSLTAAATASPAPRILDGVALTAEVDPADPDGAVLVRTAAADPLLPQRLSSPQLAVLAASAYTADGRVDPVGTGTGPFELVAVDGTASATLDRADAYWGEPAQLAGIDVDFVPDGTARAAALRTGEADVVEAVPVSQAALVEPALLHEVPMPRTNTLYLHTAAGPFADPALRAAARDSVDRSAIVDTVYEGRADVAAGLLGPALPWSADRPARAETPAGDPGAVPGGTAITLATFTDRAELPEVAVLLEQQLEAAGFAVEQVVREYSQIEADMLAGTFDAFVLSRATVLDSGDPAAYLVSDFSCAGSFSISQLCDPAVDAALTAATATAPGDARRAAVLEAERTVLESDAAVPLLHERVLQGEGAGVSGVARDPRERLLVTAGTTLAP